MSKPHSHGHCQHNHGSNVNPSALFWAVVINVLLTVAQLVGGYMADSLALVADAIHNFGDAVALFIALLAYRIAKKPVTDKMTYGYGRAEILGALVNGMALVAVSIYLLYSGASKLLAPVTEVNPKILIIVSFVALIIDGITAALIYKGSKDNLNMKAAFLHNIMDAMTSFVVMLSGFAILFFNVHRVDAIATLLIGFYIVFHTYGILKKSIAILMMAAPENINISEIKAEISKLDSVTGVGSIRLWQLDDKNIFFEGEIIVGEMSLANSQKLKTHLADLLQNEFKINNSAFDLKLNS